MTGATATKLLDAKEVAARWQLPGREPHKGVLRMVREGQIPKGVYVRLGHYVRFNLDRLEEFERDGGVAA